MEISFKEKAIEQEKKIVGTQITAEQYNMLKELSEEEFMSISNLLRKIIILYLRDNENHKNMLNYKKGEDK